MGEDLFTEMCLTKTGVSTIRALLMFDTISTISSNVQASITSNQRICALSKKVFTNVATTTKEQTSHGDLFQPQGTCSQPKNSVNPVCIFVGNQNLQKVFGCNS